MKRTHTKNINMHVEMSMGISKAPFVACVCAIALVALSLFLPTTSFAANRPHAERHQTHPEHSHPAYEPIVAELQSDPNLQHVDAVTAAREIVGNLNHVVVNQKGTDSYYLHNEHDKMRQAVSNAQDACNGGLCAVFGRHGTVYLLDKSEAAKVDVLKQILRGRTDGNVPIILYQTEPKGDPHRRRVDEILNPHYHDMFDVSGENSGTQINLSALVTAIRGQALLKDVTGGKFSKDARDELLAIAEKYTVQVAGADRHTQRQEARKKLVGEAYAIQKEQTNGMSINQFIEKYNN